MTSAVDASNSELPLVTPQGAQLHLPNAHGPLPAPSLSEAPGEAHRPPRPPRGSPTVQTLWRWPVTSRRQSLDSARSRNVWRRREASPFAHGHDWESTPRRLRAFAANPAGTDGTTAVGTSGFSRAAKLLHVDRWPFRSSSDAQRRCSRSMSGGRPKGWAQDSRPTPETQGLTKAAAPPTIDT